MFKRIYFILFLFLTLLIPQSNIIAQDNLGILQYQERISSFNSSIKVNTDSSIVVTEDITVYTNGDTIKHGIYRDFPTKYKDEQGNKYTVGFEVLDVLVNGARENYSVSDVANGVRVKIGKADVLLNPGYYTYTITYRATRELGFFPDHDELYWNVTGNGWDYNIETVTANVILPDGVPLNKIETFAYTGPFGSKGDSYSTSSGQNIVTFSTNEILSSREGLTIVVSWPKGFVSEPTAEEIRALWIKDNFDVFVGMVGLIIIFLYFYSVWNKYGRDPKKKTVIAQYEPPKDISPSEARFVLNKRFDNQCLVADIINLAVKGYLKIDKKITHYNLTKINKPYDSLILDSEKVLFESIFEDGDTVDLGDYDSNVAGTMTDFMVWLNTNYKKDYFTNNTRSLITGSISSALLIIVVALIDNSTDFGAILFMTVWLSIWTSGVMLLLVQVYSNWVKVFTSRTGNFKNISQAIFFSLFSMPFLFAEFFAFYMIYKNASLGLVLIVASLIVLNIVFYYLLKQYTEKGMRLVEEVEGFKLFLSVTEKDRMNFHNPPEKTPELFEKYLPYALALGVENKWAEQFTEVFADKKMADRHPMWSSVPIYGPAFASGFANSFSDSISSSTVRPGSHSGGGGGGSSGGGGGGSGGGGW